MEADAHTAIVTPAQDRPGQGVGVLGETAERRDVFIVRRDPHGYRAIKMYSSTDRRAAAWWVP